MRPKANQSYSIASKHSIHPTYHSDAKVVVEDVVARHWVTVLFAVLTATDLNLPPVEHHHTARLHLLQNLIQTLIVVAGAPAQTPRQVVARSERQNGDGRHAGGEVHLVDGVENPADGAVAAAAEHPKVGRVFGEAQALKGTLRGNVVHLPRIEQILKFAQDSETKEKVFGH